MNSDDNYLWDKTGEPDPEVQQLEEILGTLRYQPRSLEIPAGFTVGRGRSFFRGFAVRLAIAATVALLLLGLGLWLGVQRLQRTQQPQSVAISSPPPVNPTPAVSSTISVKDGKVNPPLPAGSGTRSGIASGHERGRNQLLAMRKQRQAEVAKNQLMLALRLASAKLSFAQKKTLNSRDEIHNQHKIG